MEAMKMTNILSKIENRQDQFDQTGVYDWATRELFPAFKGDLRPLAQRVDLWRAWIEGLPIPGTDCRSTQQPYLFRWTLALPARGLSAFLSTFPFQNRNNEETRTIGHLDPPRPGTNFFANYNISGAPFGTTHSLFPAQFGQREQHNAYAAVPNASMTCEPANNWLQRARFANPRENGNRWNAAVLGKAFDSSAVEGAPAARFVHSFPLGGTAATTRANDPFWNMRVANSLMSRHDGYRLSSFICAMHQLVMDDITPVRANIVDRVSEPKPPLIRPRSSDQFGLGAQDSPDGQSKP